MTFDPDKVINKDVFLAIKDEITCTICMMILDNPKQCTQCQNLFCNKCIIDWIEKKNSCPYKCLDFKLGDAGRIVRNMLSKIDFKCSVCEQSIDYDKYDQHTKTCKPKTYKDCPICETHNVEESKIEAFKEKIQKEASETSLILIKENKQLREQIKIFENLVNELQLKQMNNSNINISSINNVSNLRGSLELRNPISIESTNVNYNLNIPKIIEFDFSGIYEFKGQITGTNKLEDLSNTSLEGGICANTPGFIIFTLEKPCVINNIQVTGFKGNTKLWAPSNGSNAVISTSMDKFRWTVVGKIPAKFATQIANVDLTSSTGKYIKLQGTSYLGVGYFTINDKNKINEIVANVPQINPQYNKVNFSLFSSSERYSFKGEFAGKFDDINVLVDKNLQKAGGLCVTTPAEIIFKLNYEVTSDTIELGGFGGNGKIWYAENGCGAEISVSTNNVSYDKVGKIPGGFGKVVKQVKFLTKKTFTYIKFKHTSYMGIGYFRVIETIDPNHILATDTKSIYSRIVLKNKYTVNNKILGTNKVESLLDNNPLTGVVSNSPGQIIIYLAEEKTFDRIEVSGWAGDRSQWSPHNGSNSTVEGSKDLENWFYVTKLPTLTESIVTVTIEPTIAKYLRISNNSYLALGVFKIVTKELSNQVLIYPVNYTISKVYNTAFHIKTVLDLKDKNSQTGLCAASPGWISFELPTLTKVSKIECKGFTGNTTGWHPTQGIGSEIYTSADNVNWSLVGSVPKTHGAVPVNFNVVTTTAKYVKIDNKKGYLGIGYFAIVQD